jgi:small-conductance mechanosensitive channel
MLIPDRVRIAVAGWLAMACVALGAFASGIATAQPPAEVPALPATITKESVRDLMSRLSDTDVRALLIDQLDRAAVTNTSKPPATAAAADRAGMAGMVDQHAGEMRSRYDTLFSAFVGLPATLGTVVARLREPDGRPALVAVLGYVIAMLVTAFVAERIYVYALRGYRRRLLEVPAASYSARAFQLGMGLALDIGALLVFGITAILFFFASWLDHDLRRILVLQTLFIVLVLRVVVLVARFLLARTPEHARLLPFDDGPAHLLRAFIVALAALFGLGIALRSLLNAAAMSQESVDVLSVIFWIVGFLMLVSAVWAVRKPIAYLIRGDGHRGAVVGWLADLWPIAATAYFAALLVGGLFNVLAGVPLTTGTGFASVVVFVALPVIDMALCRALLAISVEHKERLTAGQMSVLADYEPVFRHAIHIVVVVSGLLAIAALWDLDVSGYAQRSLGGKIASSLLGIGIVLLVAYMLWEIVKTAIDRRLVADGDLPSDEPRTRLRTVLPILRATLLVTIVVIAALSILAAMGFDILPLLAGAGVIGVAIGFGSQTLVRDIVSGAFFLMDDAFRLGEYIEVGDAKGRVERINLRSVFLRHHRGALNILPYGEIKRLRNTSRDWSVHVMEFRLTYDTSMLQVKKILKQIGEELSADPDYAQDMLQPLKSAGVMAAEDSAIVVRAKFTARPGNTAWVVRRVAYDKIIRAFKAAGIRFAHRQVTVDVTAPAPAAAAVAAAGAGGAVAVEPVAREGSSS